MKSTTRATEALRTLSGVILVIMGAIQLGCVSNKHSSDIDHPGFIASIETDHGMWKELAEQGDPDAAYLMALATSHEDGPCFDPDASVRWYEFAASRDHPASCNNLAILHMNGQGVEQDRKKAIDLFEKACEQGHVEATGNLGVLLLIMSQSGSENHERAIELLETAAQLGDPKSHYVLGLLAFDYGEDDACRSDSIDRFKNASELGYPPADEFLGMMYRQGHLVSKDPRKAFHYLSRAGSKGRLGAITALGMMHLRGEGTWQDASKGARLLSAGAEAGLALAQNNLGILYLQGRGVKKDRAQAVFWLEKAAEQGFAPAVERLRNIGNSWEFDGSDRDFQEFTPIRLGSGTTDLLK